MCADFLETNYDRVSLWESIWKRQTLNFIIVESLSLKTIIVVTFLTFSMPSGFYRIRKAPAFWQLCYQTSVFEGSETIILTLEPHKCIFLCYQLKVKSSSGLTQFFRNLMFSSASWRTSPGQAQLHCDDQVHQPGRKPQANDELVERQQPQYPVWSLSRLQGAMRGCDVLAVWSKHMLFVNFGTRQSVPAYN